MSMSHVELLRPNLSTGRRPVPWRTAEFSNGEVIVVDDDGCQVAVAPNELLATLIVTAVNDYARALGHDFEGDTT